jgi:hypothetical protein
MELETNVMKRSICLTALLLTISLYLPANGTSDQNEDGWQYFSRMDGFSGVELKAEAELTLIPGSIWEVRARGDQRDIDDLDIYVSGKNLVIRRESFFSFNSAGERLEIEVTVPRLSEVTLASSGNVRTEGAFESGDLDLNISGSGNLFFEGIADALECKLSGSGDLKFRGRSNTLELDTNGSGNADMEIRTNLVEINLSGSGDAELTGHADMMDIRIIGSGRLQADDFPVNTAEIKVTGSGDADVQVSREIEISITGSGSVYFSGNPEYTDIESSGSGRARSK